jgi:hypothetical protein
LIDTLKEFEFYHLDDGEDEFDEEENDIAREICNIVDALAGHSSLNRIRLEGDEYQRVVGRNGWALLADLLRKQTSNLTVLHLDFSHIDDREATVLGTGISRNTTLKEIRFNRIEGITNIGWNAIISVLQLSSCRLEKLDLSWNGLNDAVILSLYDFDPLPCWEDYNCRLESLVSATEESKLNPRVVTELKTMRL